MKSRSIKKLMYLAKLRAEAAEHALLSARLEYSACQKKAQTEARKLAELRQSADDNKRAKLMEMLSAPMDRISIARMYLHYKICDETVHGQKAAVNEAQNEEKQALERLGLANDKLARILRFQRKLEIAAERLSRTGLSVNELFDEMEIEEQG